MYRILLVDDDPLIRFDLKRFPRWQEFDFIIAGEAENGHDALQQLDDGAFDLAFVDIKMPKIDGLGFLSALREQNHQLCVIILSGHSEFEYARQGFRLGAFDYLLKPVHEDSLCTLLQSARAHLDEQAAQRERQSQTQTQLAQSLRLPYAPADETRILTSLRTAPAETAALAAATADKIVKFYEHDCFKVAALLGSSYQSIIRTLLDDAPYLSEICEIEAFPEVYYTAADDASVTEWYVGRLGALADTMLRFNLTTTDSVIRLFCEYLLSHLDQDLSLETVAREIGYSSKYISKTFKEKTGESCVSYMTRLKMQHACHLVLSGKYKNYEISELLGYKNPDYFCSLFKKHFGVTPSQYKKR